jgi:hypothetical protein
MKLYYLYTTKQTNIMTTNSNIKSKEVTFTKDNQVTTTENGNNGETQEIIFV